MSFYGNILYELTNAFSSIIVKNSGSDSAAFPTIAENEVEVPAIGLGGRFELNAGNKWIGLKGDMENQSCIIFHRPIDTADTTYSFTTIANPNEAVGAIELSPGDYITGVQVTYDESGHVTGSNQIAYKLPVSDTEKDVEDIKSRMDAVELNDAEQTKVVTQVSEEFNTFKSSAEGELSTLSGQLGALENRVGSQYELTTDAGMTLTKAIGNVDSLKEATASENVCNSIIALQTSVNKQNAAITDISLAQQVVITRLCKQLEDAGINIDESALWATT